MSTDLENKICFSVDSRSQAASVKVYEHSRMLSWLLCLSAILLSSSTLFADPPVVPFNPWGTVTMSGGAAPHGAAVEAFIDNKLMAVMPGGILFGHYAIMIPADDPNTPRIDGGVDGDSVVIRVDGKAVSEILVWRSGNAERVDLHVQPQRRLVVSPTLPACEQGDAEFTRISRAVQNANDGDVIIVCSGSYQDNVEVNRSIRIEGSDPNTTTVTSATGGHLFHVSADNVTIMRLTLSGATGAGNSAAIQVDANQISIADNTISNNSYGIEITAARGGGEILNNTITSNEEGVVLSGASKNEILGNQVASNTQYGIRLAASANNLIGDNNLQNNRCGIWLHGSSGSNQILGNAVAGNVLCGVKLTNSVGNVISRNTISLNDKGIHLEQSSVNNTIENNNITNNAVSLYNDQTNVVSAENNWWGSVVCTIIDSGIFDDEEGRGEVDFGPVLNAEFAIGTSVPCGGSLPLVVHRSTSPCVTGIAYYPDITSAVAAASKGDVIVVCPGLYEENVVVDKSVTIESHAGPSVTTVRSCNFRDPNGICRGFKDIFQVANVQNVTISGFTLTGTEPNPFAGVYLVNATNCTVNDNIFIDNDIGIKIDFQSGNNLLYNNSFSNNSFNAQDQGMTNAWNLPNIVAGTNILGGPFLGGNFWDDYVGNDLNGDGIGDENLPYDANGNIQHGGDSYPLVATP